MVRHVVLLALCAVLLSFGTARAGPADAQPGATVVVSKAEGAPLRAEPKGLSQAVQQLPPGTQVVVQSVNMSWAYVRVASGPAAGTMGWLTVNEVAAPGPGGAPPAAPPRQRIQRPLGTGSASSQQVSAAGRQLDAATENGYRQQHPDLNRYYPIVDEMERATDALDDTACLQFSRQASLGGAAGSDFARPPLIGTMQQPQGGSGKRDDGADKAKEVVGGLLGGLGERLGGKGGRRVAEVAKTAFNTISELATQVEKAFTPEQEYYIGRAVAANAIAKYGVEPDANLRRYVRTVGDSVVRWSTQLPANWGGYHFEVLNTDEVNGISGPGGFVLLTRGAVKSCKDEDELASILAHELSHVYLKHGEQAVRQSGRISTLAKGLLQGVTSAIGEAEVLGRKVQFFDGAVGAFTSQLGDHNYGVQSEFQADEQGAYIARNVGYDWTSLRDYLVRLGQMPGHEHGGAGHAPPADRANYVSSKIAAFGAYPNAKPKALRAQRFAQNVKT